MLECEGTAQSACAQHRQRQSSTTHAINQRVLAEQRTRPLEGILREGSGLVMPLARVPGRVEALKRGNPDDKEGHYAEEEDGADVPRVARVTLDIAAALAS